MTQSDLVSRLPYDQDVRQIDNSGGNDHPKTLTVYLPRDIERPLLGIREGSGIVGGCQPAPSGRIAVDYEGNIYGSNGLSRYANRVLHAAGRHATAYPTVARARVEADELVAIGEFDETSGEITLAGDDEREQLCRWLGVSDLDDDALRADGARFQMRREIIAASSSPDPARRHAAEQMRRRYDVKICPGHSYSRRRHAGRAAGPSSN